jgi:DNA modification methylase
VTISILQGDCRDVLAGLPADSLHACLTDPPYGLEFMGREWDKFNDKPRRVNGTGGREAPFAHHAVNPSGSRNVGYQQWCETWARELYRVLKPGAFLMAFGGTRTYHRLACAIEDAGFEIRDQFAWCYGSGFPKSRDASKAIDQEIGATREVLGKRTDGRYAYLGCDITGGRTVGGTPGTVEIGQITAPATPEAAAWEGFGTAVKPAWEPLVLARKPMIGNLAQNLLKHGCGALNIDGCRVETDESLPVFATSGGRKFEQSHTQESRKTKQVGTHTLGRWPANLAHDGSPEVVAAFAAYGDKSSTRANGNPNDPIHGSNGSGRSYEWGEVGRASIDHRDAGTAARFFYTAKADKADRADSKHPTVKPVDLIRHYMRLITPPGGTVIDCFAGSGTGGEAAMLEGFDCVLIERDPKSVADIHHRIARWSGGDMPLFADAAQ